MSTKNLKSDSDLRKYAENFFRAARNAVCLDHNEIKEFYKGRLPMMYKGIIFKDDEVVVEQLRQLVARCAKLVGPRYGNEKEISNIAWEHVWQSLAGNERTSDENKIVNKFISELEERSTRTFDYIESNFLVRFIESARKVTIGPVEALYTEDLSPGPKWEFMRGTRFELEVVDNKILIQMTPICWKVIVKAAPGHVAEEAAWLINVAISLLRLSYPAGRHDFFPDLGDLETLPLRKPKAYNQGVTISQNTISARGGTMPKLYQIGDGVFQTTEEETFKSRAQAVFFHKKGDLAERFSQGLGWMTRGRQTEDRSERFLFFFTAIESLLSSDDKSAPVVQTIARYAAVILDENPEKREEIAKRIKSLYGARSALVHAGKRQVSKVDANTVQYIVEILYKAVLEQVDLTMTFQSFQESLAKSSYGLKWPVQ